jgi:methionine aminopeptidase
MAIIPDAITIKTPDEIEKMRVAGRLAAEVLQVVAPHVKPGVTTAELDRICHDHIVKVQNAIRPTSATRASRRRSARRSTTSSATASRARPRSSRTATSSISMSP